jgi:tetratricopeptide (TPR) repeat protein
MRKSVEQFEAALRVDSSHALAHAALADTYIIQAAANGVNPAEQRNKTHAAIERALSLDPNLAEAHVAAGMASFFMDWEWEAAERSFLRAIKLNANNAIAHQFYGHLLSNWKRHEEAIAEIRKARELDPLSPMMHTFEAGYLTMAKRYGDAQAPIQQALTIDRDFFPAQSVLGLIHQQTGNPGAALEDFREAYRLSRGNVLQLAYQGVVLGQTARQDEARQVIAAMNEISKSRYVPPFAFALVYTALGDHDAAFEWLEKAHQVRDLGMVFLPGHPHLDSLRSDRRFQSLLKRCGFPA